MVVWVTLWVVPAQEWGCGLPFPVGAAVVAAGGFLLAALWIDTIATELVSIIEYLGLLSGINHTVGLLCNLLTSSHQGASAGAVQGQEVLSGRTRDGLC